MSSKESDLSFAPQTLTGFEVNKVRSFLSVGHLNSSGNQFDSFGCFQIKDSQGKTSALWSAKLLNVYPDASLLSIDPLEQKDPLYLIQKYQTVKIPTSSIRRVAYSYVIESGSDNTIEVSFGENGAKLEGEVRVPLLDIEDRGRILFFPTKRLVGRDRWVEVYWGVVILNSPDHKKEIVPAYFEPK